MTSAHSENCVKKVGSKAFFIRQKKSKTDESRTLPQTKYTLDFSFFEQLKSSEQLVTLHDVQTQFHRLQRLHFHLSLLSALISGSLASFSTLRSALKCKICALLVAQVVENLQCNRPIFTNFVKSFCFYPQKYRSYIFLCRMFEFHTTT